MTDKEIIIDGINVTNCNYIINYDPPKGQGTWGGAIHKGACRTYSKDCKYNSNCYFKQLARKTQELYSAQNEVHFKTEYIQEQRDIIKKLEQKCEELKEELELNTQNAVTLDMAKRLYNYRKALDEIETVTKINCEEVCGRKFADCNDTSCFSAEILNIISKAKDSK